jgi:hypothetical protein
MNKRSYENTRIFRVRIHYLGILSTIVEESKLLFSGVFTPGDKGLSCDEMNRD